MTLYGVLVMRYRREPGAGTQDGASRGVFLHKAPRASLGPALQAVLATALEITSAVAHLHRCGVVHGGKQTCHAKHV